MSLYHRHSTHGHVIKLLQGSGSAPKIQVQQLLDENGGKVTDVSKKFLSGLSFPF
jgi:hypothetical protein